MDLRLKINGPSQIRYNEPAQFKCSSNVESSELTLEIFQDDKVTWTQSFSGGHGEIRLNPGEIQHGTQQFFIDCGAYNNDKDWVSYKHFVDVLCKYYKYYIKVLHKNHKN